MRGRRVLLNTLGATLIITGALAAGAYMREHRAGQASPSVEPVAAVGATAPTASPAPGNCDVLGRIPPVVPAALSVQSVGTGAKKLTSEEAGYALTISDSWLVTADMFGGKTAWFGHAHMSSFDPRTIDLRRPESPNMLPPEYGIRLDIELWANPARESAERYAEWIRIGPDQLSVLPGSSVTIAGQPAYRTTIQDQHQFQPTNAPLIVTRQTRMLWLIPSLRADRMLVVYATPGESPLRGSVEAAVSTLELFQPTQPQLPVIHQRDEILKRWTIDKSGATIVGQRVEAKLMSYAEANAAMNNGSGGIFRIDRDPDELFWLVAVSGPNLPRGRGGPHGTQPPTAWIMYNTPAASDRFEMTGTMYSANGKWPPAFDALPDLCH